ncbi:hypothetical protein CCAX7_002870 [Capsulimonas corticalis]|uniref:Uncharacterized protein n=1 Tax=Capsulimonas corticalis TaxID=2219043 RepID=A0A402CS10_9BACT|nr:hypothetical protein [Capsulimonas corticalis]BDI28236.1 hypothetical protein CCAX7_002870 [Capsulimonas corticalis]
MKRNHTILLAALCAVALAGCGSRDGNSGDPLAQQRKDVMGSPAPPAEQAKIAAMQAEQAQKMQSAQAAGQAAAQKSGKP